MSRIVALLNRDGRPAEREVLERMIAPLRLRATDGPRFWQGGAAGLAYQCLRDFSGRDDQQPAEQSGLTLCFDGRLDNREELIAALGEDLKADAAELADAALVRACYRRFGEAFPGRLNGDFALALYDGAEKKLLLARDVIGVRPLYYYDSGGVFLAASEIKAILAHPQVRFQPNDVAVADLVVGGNLYELRHTFFQGVWRVLPGSTIVITPGEVREFRHWDFDPMRQVRLKSTAEYAEALRELFTQAVRRRLRAPGPVAVMVSGGLDSSAILCEAERLKRSGENVAEAQGISMVFPEGTPADESKYLSDIETMYGLKIRRLLFPSFQFVDDTDSLERTEYPRLRWNSERVTLDAACQLNCAVVLDGDYGDQMMSSNAHPLELARRFHWLELRSQIRTLSRSMGITRRVFLGGLLWDLVRDAMPDRFMRSIRMVRRLRRRTPRWFASSLDDLAYRRGYYQEVRGPGPFASKQAEICAGYLRRANVVNPFEEINKMAAAYGMDKAYPFMDRDLVSFMMAIPGELVNQGGTFKGLFRQAMRGILPESIRLRNGKADFTGLDTGAAATGYSRFGEYLRRDSLAVKYGYLDPAALPGALDEHRGRLTGETMYPAAAVSAVVGLELWLRAFAEAESANGAGYSLTCETSR